jgi:hypothetical protein
MLDSDTGSCPAPSGLRGIGVNKSEALPFDKNTAKRLCEIEYSNNLTDTVAAPGRTNRNSGWCCKVTGNIGTCDNSKNEFGENGRSPAFASKSSAEKQCSEMGGDCVARQSKTGTGWCSVRPQPAPPAPSPAAKHNVTIKYKIEAFRLTDFTLFPLLGRPIPFLPLKGKEFSVGVFHGSNTYEHTVSYQDIPSGKYAVQCLMTVSDVKDRVCTPAEINVTGNVCRIYNITVKSGVIEKSSLGAPCPVGNSGRPIQPAALDMNDDGTINTIDLQYLYDDYGAEGASTSDVNSDGTVNALDLSTFMNSFGTEL